MYIPEKLEKPIQWARYIGINGLFTVCIYFGFFAPELIDGAANVALFLAWMTAAAGIFLLLVMILAGYAGIYDKFEDAFAKREESVVPFWFDFAFDMCVILAFVYLGYWGLAICYFVSVIVGKMLRDIPQNVMMKKLKATRS